jgi:hypothetical protein
MERNGVDRDTFNNSINDPSIYILSNELGSYVSNLFSQMEIENINYKSIRKLIEQNELLPNFVPDYIISIIPSEPDLDMLLNQFLKLKTVYGKKLSLNLHFLIHSDVEKTEKFKSILAFMEYHKNIVKFNNYEEITRFFSELFKL